MNASTVLDGRRSRAAVLAVLLLGTIPGLASAAVLSVEVSPGFDGWYKVGRPLPVRVTVENRHADWEGEIRVDRFSLPVTLPAPSKKSFYFELPAPERRETLEVRLERGGEVRRVEAPLKPLSETAELFVFVSERPPAFTARPAVHVRAVDLPESWRGYSSVDGVVLEGTSAGELRPAQHRALADYLLLGGRLVLAARDPARLRPILPRWSLSPLGGAPSGAEDFRRGRGIVRLVAAPVEASTVRKLFADRPPPPPEGAGRDLLLRLPAPAEVRPRWAGPLIAGFLVYVVLMAAALHLLARPPAHPLWSVGAALGLALLFTLSIGGLGRLVHGGRMLVSTASLVHVFADSEESFVVARTDVLSAQQREVRWQPLLRDAGEEAEESWIEGRSLVVAAPMWARHRISSEGFTVTGLRIEAPPGVPARITNGSGAALRGCLLLEDGEVRRLPDLASGESAELSGAVGLQGSPAAGDGLFGRVLSAYRGAGEGVVCSVDAVLPVLSADRPLERLGGRTVAVFHLPR